MTAHRDFRLNDILGAWNANYQSPTARACRRMFRDRVDMDLFFELAWPGSRSPGHAGMVHHQGVNGYAGFDCLKAMADMDAIRATPDDFQVAAYLVYAEDAYYIPVDDREARGTGILPEEVPTAKAFLKRFRGHTAEELKLAFGKESWRAGDMVEWVSGCFERGIPASYLDELARGEYARYYLEEWSPEFLAGLYEEGVPAVYIANFWTRPAKFDTLHKGGIPYEYAMVLDEGPER